MEIGWSLVLRSCRAHYNKAGRTSVELVQYYLDRIEQYDQTGPGLNAIASINPMAKSEAAKIGR